LIDELIESGMKVGNIRLDDTSVNLLTSVVDGFPLVPGLQLGLVVSRGNVITDNRVALDLSNPSLDMGYDIGFQNVPTVCRGGVTDMTLPSRYTRVGLGERVQVVQVEIRSGDALVNLFWRWTE
jgi:hypothetical protein